MERIMRARYLRDRGGAAPEVSEQAAADRASHSAIAKYYVERCSCAEVMHRSEVREAVRPFSEVRSNRLVVFAWRTAVLLIRESPSYR